MTLYADKDLLERISGMTLQNALFSYSITQAVFSVLTDVGFLFCCPLTLSRVCVIE